MRCPVCNEAEMVEGKLHNKKATAGWLLFGWGWSELYFEDGKGNETYLLSAHDYFDGFRCPSCEALVADPRRTRENKPKPYVPENLF